MTKIPLGEAGEEDEDEGKRCKLGTYIRKNVLYKKLRF
jgi:hypothetical protein